MGLNIDMYRVHDVTAHKFKSIGSFDYSRHSGDNAFATFLISHGHAISCQRPFCCDWIFVRPDDFDETQQWIQENIETSDQERLLDAVIEMRQDESLWLYFGY